LVNGIKNESKNATAIYTKIINSNCRVLLLSGTPVFNSIAGEWSIVMKLLKKGTYTKEEELKGIISYYPGDPSLYPEVRYHEPIKVEMTDDQFAKYIEVYKAELALRGIGPPPQDMKISNPGAYYIAHAQFMRAVKYVMCRRWSNFYYPPSIVKDMSEDICGICNKFPENSITEPSCGGVFCEICISTWKDKNNICPLCGTKKPKYESIRDKVKKPDKLTKYGGWIDDEVLSDKKLLTLYSPKFTALFINILSEFNTKHMVYTFYKERSGVQLLKTLFDKCGIPSEIFSGDLTDVDRASILHRFNKVDNRDGKYIKVLLVTEAGAEGITLLETNNMHILESSPKEKKTDQAIGRVVRYKSHINMPPERRYVNVWRYWSTWQYKTCVDEELYISGVIKIDEINKFLEKLIDNAIENTM
jgi:hypothetical protein